MLVLAGGGLAPVRTAVLLLAEEEGPRASSNQPFQTSGLTNTKAKLSIVFLLDWFYDYVAHLGIRTGSFSNFTTYFNECFTEIKVLISLRTRATFSDKLSNKKNN